MSRTIRHSILALLAISICSCNDTFEDELLTEQESLPVLKADITSVIVPAEEEGSAPTDRTVMITSTMNWTASLENAGDWVSVDKTSYTALDGKAGKSLLILSFQKYEEVSSDRTATLKIKGESDAIDITITQTRTKAYIILQGSSDITLPSAKPCQSTVSFCSNASWTAVLDDSTTAGASLSATSGTGDGEITVSFSENQDTEAEKEATLILQAPDLDEPVTVHFTQPKAIPIKLTASAQEVMVPASMPDNSTVTSSLTITSNTSWTASLNPEATWVSVAPASNENDTMEDVSTQLTLTFQDYEDLTVNRTATLTVTTNDGKKKLEIPIIQNKKEAFVQFVSGDTDYTGSAAGSIQLEFISTGDWTASLKDAADGIVLPVTSGNKDVSTLTVQFGEFMCAGASRSATVVLTSASGTTDEVLVRQLGTELYLDFSGGQQPFTTEIAAGTLITDTETEYTLSVYGNNYSFVLYAKGGYTYINKPDGQSCGINWTPNDKNSWIKFPAIESMKLMTVRMYTANTSSAANKGVYLREDPVSTTNQVQKWDFASANAWGEISTKNPDYGKSYYMVAGNKSIIFSKLHLIYEY